MVDANNLGVPLQRSRADTGAVSVLRSLPGVQREVVALGASGLEKDDWCRAADALLQRVLPHDAACWHTMDPATLLIASHCTLDLPDRFPLLAANEYLADDVNKFADLARSTPPVGVLSQVTDGQPQRSLRWREMLRPNGFDAELRASFVDAGMCWGSLILLRDHGRDDFSADESAAAEQLSGVLARTLRQVQIASAAAADTSEGPGLLMLDRAGSIESATRAAHHWLDPFDGQPPPAVFAVAATARGGGEARSRVQTPAGHWLIVHGARLDGDPLDRTSVIIEPARPADLIPLVAAAYDLSPREQDVTALVLRGSSTRQIARALGISPYTVQEHLTAVFDKTAVRSRGELIGQIFFRHCLPDIA